MKNEWWEMRMLLPAIAYRRPVRFALRYGAAVFAVAAGMVLYWIITAWEGPGLPTFITFYPAIMLVALLGGFWPGMLATALAGVAVAYWIMPPIGQFSVALPVDRTALALFGAMGLFISAVAEASRRSARKAAAYDQEEALRETRRENEFLANLLEHAAQPFAVGYPDGRLGRFNRAYAELAGYTAAELRSLDWSSALTPSEWREPEKRELESLSRTGRPIRYEKEYIRKDGSLVPIELFVHLVRDAAGEPEYYYSFLTDITARKKAEQALHESEAQYRLLFDANPNPMFVFDEETLGFLAVNEAAVRYYGWSREEFLAMTVLDIRPPEKRAPAEELIRLRRGARESAIGTRLHCRKDGTAMDMEITVSSIPFAGRPGRLCSMTDVTETRRFEKALQKAHVELLEHAHKLEETNRELESFAYTISHDLRSPLRAINGFARMLSDDHGRSLDEEAKRLLEVIEMNAVKMGLLIDDLLAFSRSGRTAMNISPIDMNGLAADVVETLKTSEGGVKGEIHVASLPSARGDRTLIRQVMTNLLENAVKFSGKSSDPQVEVGSLEKEGERVYFVKDNGIGFDMKYREKLFGVFQRLVTEKEFEGTGVGLAIVHRLVTRHGGRVWAEAKPGEGATFFFTLKQQS